MSCHHDCEYNCGGTDCFAPEAQYRKSEDVKELLYGGAYNFKSQPERLKYIGKCRGWHQFEKVGQQGVWCEILDRDFHMIEETKDEVSADANQRTTKS